MSALDLTIASRLVDWLFQTKPTTRLIQNSESSSMLRLLAVIATATTLFTSHARAENGPVVIELYTSQGCSSCPPADAMLHDLAKRSDVIALALHVDYWDYIGWKDSFGRPENTQRQHAYARAAEATMVYTPQMVIGGVDHVIGSRPMQVMDVLQAHLDQGAKVVVAADRRGGALRITAPSTQRGAYIVQVARFIPEETVEIRRGENAGRALSYANILTDLDVVAEWDGASRLDLDVDISGSLPGAVIVQVAGHGAIVGAAYIR